MENLRPLLSVNLVPAISDPVSKVPYDIIKVAKLKILPGRGPTGFCLVDSNLTRVPPADARATRGEEGHGDHRHGPARCGEEDGDPPAAAAAGSRRAEEWQCLVRTC